MKARSHTWNMLALKFDAGYTLPNPQFACLSRGNPHDVAASVKAGRQANCAFEESMSIKIMSRVWDFHADSHTQKLVLLALADNANDQGYCWPSVPTIAKKCDLTDRSVQRQIKALAGRGLLQIKLKYGHSSSYVLKLPSGEQESPPMVTGSHRTGDRRSPSVVTGCHPEPSVDPSREPSVDPSGQKSSPFLEGSASLMKDFKRELAKLTNLKKFKP